MPLSLKSLTLHQADNLVVMQVGVANYVPTHAVSHPNPVTHCQEGKKIYILMTPD